MHIPEFTNALGHRICNVEVKDLDDALSTFKRFGAHGFTCGKLPPRGIVLPLSMADTFDWTLIGAREYTDKDGERAVWFKGEVYTRRDLAANEKKNMGAAIKYSRGAKPYDPPESIEGEEGSNFRYVTLVIFRGNGRPIERWCKPKAAAQPAA